MAVTHQDYTGNGTQTDFVISNFDFIHKNDVRATVGNVSQTIDSDYTVDGNTVTFLSGSIPGDTVAVRLYRRTSLDQPKHVFQTGASVKADDLNLNNKQLRYYLQELGTPTAASTGLPLTDTVKNDIEVVNANEFVIVNEAVEAAMIRNDAVTADKLADDSVVTDTIADDAVNADKLANSINTEIAANTAKVTNATHTGEVTGATALTIADNVVDEANLQVSNAPTDGHFLSAQAGNTGGLTWAEVDVGLVKNLVTANTTTAVDMDNTLTDTGLTADITVTGTNKVLVIVQQAYRIQDSDGGYSWDLKLLRDTTVIVERQMHHDATSSGNSEKDFHNIVYLDDPGSGTKTYKTQMKGNSANDAKAQPSSARSDIFLFEVNI